MRYDRHWCVVALPACMCVLLLYALLFPDSHSSLDSTTTTAIGTIPSVDPSGVGSDSNGAGGPQESTSSQALIDASPPHVSSSRDIPAHLRVPRHCMVPDKRQMTELLLRDDLPLPKPILNLGMPKVGSSTLRTFFECTGYRTSHGKTTRHGPTGQCMYEAVEKGLPPIASCDSYINMGENRQTLPHDKDVEALMQLDYDNPPCHFPQLSYLDEFHQESPNATFILVFRPIHHWHKSMGKWLNMTGRLATCDLPGLPAGVGMKVEELAAWHCWHVKRVRDFVEAHPSHALIELDLYDTENSASAMAKLFNSKESCWRHMNAGKTI